jgi:hypothetical protein
MSAFKVQKKRENRITCCLSHAWGCLVPALCPAGWLAVALWLWLWLWRCGVWRLPPPPGFASC